MTKLKSFPEKPNEARILLLAIMIAIPLAWMSAQVHKSGFWETGLYVLGIILVFLIGQMYYYTRKLNK